MSKQKHTATGNFSNQAPVLVKDQKGKVSAVRYDYLPLKAIELTRKKGAHINVMISCPTFYRREMPLPGSPERLPSAAR